MKTNSEVLWEWSYEKVMRKCYSIYGFVCNHSLVLVLFFLRFFGCCMLSVLSLKTWKWFSMAVLFPSKIQRVCYWNLKSSISFLTSIPRLFLISILERTNILRIIIEHMLFFFFYHYLVFCHVISFQ